MYRQGNRACGHNIRVIALYSWVMPLFRNCGQQASETILAFDPYFFWKELRPSQVVSAL